MLLDEIETRVRGAFDLRRAPFASILQFVDAQDEEQAKSFYTRYLDDLAPQPDIPATEDPRDFGTVVEEVEIGLDALENNCRSAGIGLHALSQAAFGSALAEHYGCSDIVRVYSMYPAATDALKGHRCGTFRSNDSS